MDKLYVVISCDCDEPGTVDIVEIYSKKRLARTKVLEMLKNNFSGMSSDNRKESLKYSKECKNIDLKNIKWKNVRECFKAELKKQDECEIYFGSQSYQIAIRIVDAD